MSEKSDNWRKDYPNLNRSENSINKRELQAKMYYKFMKKRKKRVLFDPKTGLYLDLDGKLKTFSNLSIEGKKAWENQYRYNINENEHEI